MKKNCTGFFIKIHPPTEEGETWEAVNQLIKTTN